MDFNRIWKSNILLIILQIVLVFALVACTANNEADFSPEEKTSEDNGIVSLEFPMPSYEDEIIDDGLLIKITTSKSTYQLGEDVPMVVYVENQSSQTISYTYSSKVIYVSVSGGNQDNPLFAVISKDGHTSRYAYDILIAKFGELKAGESITYNTFWNQTGFEFNGDEEESINVTSGAYSLTASFVGRPDLTVRTTIQVK